MVLKLEKQKKLIQIHGNIKEMLGMLRIFQCNSGIGKG